MGLNIVLISNLLSVTKYNYYNRPAGCVLILVVLNIGLRLENSIWIGYPWSNMYVMLPIFLGGVYMFSACSWGYHSTIKNMLDTLVGLGQCGDMLNHSSSGLTINSSPEISLDIVYNDNKTALPLPLPLAAFTLYNACHVIWKPPWSIYFVWMLKYVS